MATELTLEIVTPERMTFKGVVEEVTIPGTEGQFGVLKGHASLLSSVDIGELSFIRDQKKTRYAVNTGYAEVTASKVTVLVETAERSDMIDAERARRARERAEEKLTKVSREDKEFEKARLALLRAVTRLNVAGKG
jgi:F-type H+-transporting ATPase subunit epsilon